MKQDNPQQATAYITGIIDGEGTIRVQNQRRRASQFVPQVTVTSVTPEVLEYMQNYFGGWIRKYQPKSQNGNAREAFVWTLTGRQNVLILMQAIQPYCIIKREHVKLMIEFVEEGEVTHPPHPVSPKEVSRRKSIFEKFGQLNMRGVQLQRLSEETASPADATVRSEGMIQPSEDSRNVVPPSSGGQ